MMKFFSIQFTDKEEEFLIEKNKSTNFQKEIESLKATLKNREDYISNLKTEDEIKEMEQVVSKNRFFALFLFILTIFFQKLELSNEIDILKSKILTHEKKYLKSKGLIFDKVTI